MSTTDYILLAVMLIILGGAIFYILKAKKSGQKCVGCPYSKSCSGGCGGNGDKNK